MTNKEIEAEIAELAASNKAAPGWGAAVGARLERIKELESELRRRSFKSGGSAVKSGMHSPIENTGE
jgi:hypothetical protein